MFEQQSGVYDNPYKFNAKELDAETGLYYYGVRYYNPKLSIWYGVDPLAVYNPVMETQFYGDGQHNGGVFYWGNLNPYIYDNPVNLIDPNGKQTASKAHNGGGYRGIGVPIPMFEHHGTYLPFPVYTQEEFREGFDKLKDGAKSVAVLGFNMTAASSSSLWVPLIDKYKELNKWSNRVLNSNNGFIDTKSADVNSEIKKIVAGNGSVRIDRDTGLPQVYENRDNSKKQRTWGGSIEYNVTTKDSGDNKRILKRTNKDGSTTYGYTLDHYKTIHEFKEK